MSIGHGRAQARGLRGARRGLHIMIHLPVPLHPMNSSTSNPPRARTAAPAPSQSRRTPSRRIDGGKRRRRAATCECRPGSTPKGVLPVLPTTPPRATSVEFGSPPSGTSHAAPRAIARRRAKPLAPPSSGCPRPRRHIRAYHRPGLQYPQGPGHCLRRVTARCACARECGCARALFGRRGRWRLADLDSSRGRASLSDGARTARWEFVPQ